ncbi:hypothetical protein [uncultured Deinococcus sp.]|uniref:hypothetical protein n=1 Tax=uncultured Deinococcus sp. TaxID=158789 RepID=UPI0025ECDCE3|nr:hypothetical protein [uncultured Deinococcus sp.]
MPIPEPFTPESDAEVLQLAQVQLVQQLEAAYASLYRTQRYHDASHRTCRLLAERRLVWPIRLHVVGWPWPWIGGRPVLSIRHAFWSRHGVRQWYGVVQVVRLGWLLIELGRDPALDARRTADMPPGAWSEAGVWDSARTVARAGQRTALQTARAQRDLRRQQERAPHLH